APAEPARYADLRRGPDQVPAETVARWRAEFAGARRGALPTTGGGRTPGGATALVTAGLDAAAEAALRRLAAEHRGSPYMVLLAALGGLLDDGRGEPGRADLTVFAVHDTRSRAGRDTLGFFAEPLPLRLRFDRSAPLGAAVHVAREAVLAGLSRGGVPFLRLLEAAPRLAVALLRGRRPATLVQYLAARDLWLGELRGVVLPTFQAAVPGEAHPAVLPIDLDLTVERCGDAHSVAALYDPGLWSRCDVERALHRLAATLVGADAHPARPLAELAQAAA
ncbi:MAG: hypothetical protein L0H64_14265, partial [Pseudonocardia sp.]|nr:hypothetical protein [Pseudonocardia sp.]